MFEPNRDDQALNLAARALSEFKRAPVCKSASNDQTDYPVLELQGPHSSRRCLSSQRELFRNRFPAE